MPDRISLMASLEGCTTPASIVELFAQLVEDNGELKGFSTLTPAIYDTAWLSMVHRPAPNGTTEWLFPSCWDTIIDTQQEDGTWPSYSSPIDGILNTLASILALLTRRKCGKNQCDTEDVLVGRIQKAESGLQSLLRSWSIESTVHVGFEVLVPRLLDQIAAFGIHFSFPAETQLRRLYAEKSKKFRPEIVYEKKPTTLLHSIEALIGLIDFDKVRHHCREESGILGSPAATAAYLMNVTDWDKNAELYLKTVVKQYGSSVPSAFPTEIFEVSWTLSILIPRAVQIDDLAPESVQKLTRYLGKLLHSHNGLIGFTKGVLPDADDTSRVMLASSALGASVNAQSLLEKFATTTHFRTYELEGSPSFTANCNVLLALLASPSAQEYGPMIEKAAKFLLGKWDEGDITDKWNLEKGYVLMLFSDCIVRLLQKWDDGVISPLPTVCTQERLKITLCQILSHLLASQMADGSWGHSLERTSYCVLTLAQSLALPWSASIRQSLLDVLRAAQGFMSTTTQTKSKGNDYIWVEKVSYGTSLFQQTYTVCALHAACDEVSWTPDFRSRFCVTDAAKAKKMGGLFKQTPLIKKHPITCLELLLLESSHHAKRLRAEVETVFSESQMPATDDKYLEFIPIFWTVCNYVSENPLPPKVIWDMCVLSLLVYQIDAYMEAVVANMPVQSIDAIKGFLAEMCDDRKLSKKRKRSLEDEGLRHCENMSLDDTPVKNVCKTLEEYTKWVLERPSVLQSPPSIQKQLTGEIHTFFLAHITHIVDNQKLRQLRCDLQKGEKDIHRPASLNSTYIDWVTTIGADDTSCPFASLFFTCCISEAGTNCCSTSPQAKYAFQSMSRHLAIMCRQYNDFGSAERDFDESNLNSLDFPDFRGGPSEVQIDMYSKPTDQSKDILMEIAEYERSCMDLAIQHLRGAEGMKEETMRKLQVFIDVTDLWGQIYVVRDLTGRLMKQAGTSGQTI